MHPILTLSLTSLAVFALWPWPVFFPFKLLVVFFHESSHALMTVATGGEVRELVVNSMQGGHVISVGGNRFLTLTAGYLGSLLWGVVIYLAAATSRFDKILMVLLAMAIAAVCAWFVRDTYALAFAGSVALIMAALGWKASHAVNDAVLRVIGLTSMLYAPLDIWSDTIARSSLRSDAYMLAEEFGGSTVAWGGAWLAASVLIIAAALALSLRMPGQTSDGGSPRYSGSVNYDD